MVDILIAKRLKYFKGKQIEAKRMELEKIKEEYEALCVLCNLLEQMEQKDKAGK